MRKSHSNYSLSTVRLQLCRGGGDAIGQGDVCSFLLQQMQQRESQARAHATAPLPHHPAFCSALHSKVGIYSQPLPRVYTTAGDLPTTLALSFLRRPSAQYCLWPALHSTSQSARYCHESRCIAGANTKRWRRWHHREYHTAR